LCTRNSYNSKVQHTYIHTYSVHVLSTFMIIFREGITKCSNEVYNKLTKYTSAQQLFIGAIGYMFRPVNRSSSGLQQNKSLS